MDIDCLMHTLLNALLIACNIAIIPLDSVRTHGQSCAYKYKLILINSILCLAMYVRFQKYSVIFLLWPFPLLIFLLVFCYIFTVINIVYYVYLTCNLYIVLFVLCVNNFLICSYLHPTPPSSASPRTSST